MDVSWTRSSTTAARSTARSRRKSQDARAAPPAEDAPGSVASRPSHSGDTLATTTRIPGSTARSATSYASWAERSCVDRSVASKVLVAEHEGRVAGFLTLLERGTEEQESSERRQSGAPAARHLPRPRARGDARARCDGASRLIVSTQLINLGVQKTWTRLGFEPSRSSFPFRLRPEPLSSFFFR